MLLPVLFLVCGYRQGSVMSFVSLGIPGYTISQRWIPYIQSYPVLQPVFEIPAKAADDHRKTVVLDLDETLIHCSVKRKLPNSDIEFGGVPPVSCILRPYALTFLQKLASKYELIVFTAGTPAYAELIVDYFEKYMNFETRVPYSLKLFSHVLYSTECTQIKVRGLPIVIKDLRRLGRDMKTTVIIDNSPLAIGYALDNTIPIIDFFGDKGDRELISMVKWVDQFFMNDDVRIPLAKTYGLRAQVETTKKIKSMIRQREKNQLRIETDALAQNARDFEEFYKLLSRMEALDAEEKKMKMDFLEAEAKDAEKFKIAPELESDDLKDPKHYEIIVPNQVIDSGVKFEDVPKQVIDSGMKFEDANQNDNFGPMFDIQASEAAIPVAVMG